MLKKLKRNIYGVTVKDVAQAMIDDKTGKAISTFGPTQWNEYCAVGGAAHVLGLSARVLADALRAVDRDGVPVVLPLGIYPHKFPLRDTIFEWNDSTNKSKADIGRLILDNADEKTLNTRLRL